MKSLSDLVAAAKAEISEIDAGELKAKVDNGDDLLLVDLREPAEVACGIIPGAVVIPRGVLESSADLNFPARHPELSEARGREVVLYCASGGRSALAAKTLEVMGFNQVSSLAGGIGKWVDEGNAVANKAT